MKFSNTLLLDYSKMRSHYNRLGSSTFLAIYENGINPRHTEKTSLGSSDFDPILISIIEYNRVFVKLIEIKEPLVATPIIRMQLENLIYIYAESLYPHQVLYRIYDHSREFNQIIIEGKSLKTSDFLNLLDEKYNGIKDIWKYYCRLIHPSSKHDEIRKQTRYRETIKPLIRDMKLINQIITDTLLSIIHNLREND